MIQPSIVVRYAQIGNNLELQVFEREMDVQPSFTVIEFPLVMGTFLLIALSAGVWCLQVCLCYLQRYMQILRNVLFFTFFLLSFTFFLLL